MKKMKVLEVHPYKVTAPKSTSLWQTYIANNDGTRKKITAVDESTLYNKLYEHYYGNSIINLVNLYPQWEKQRMNSNVSDRTVRRNFNHWNKYYINHPIVKKNIKNITFLDIEDFFHMSIKVYNLTLKELNNMKFIMKDMMRMALRMCIVNSNPWNDVEINTVGCRPPNNRSAADRTFSDIDTAKLFKVLNQESNAKPNITDFHAIQLLYLLALRIGEVTALKFSDINWQTSEIHIHRTETVSIDSDGRHHVVVVEHTKKKSRSGDRFLPLSERELTLLKVIKTINESNGYYQDGYLFCDNKARMTVRQLASRLKRLCLKAGVYDKTSHDIRRTVASQLHMQNVPIKIIKNYLGHSSEAQTWQYIYDKNEKALTKRIILNALDPFCQLKVTQGDSIKSH